MRVCMHVTACHNVGKAAYSTEGLLLTVLRNIGTNAFFFSHLKFFFFSILVFFIVRPAIIKKNI